MKTVLFLCTGNYYRSRFAEFYFRHLANQQSLNWRAESRGLRISPGNVGPLSVFTHQECERRGICAEPLRMPVAVEESDFRSASITIAVKELEHRPLMQLRFPDWENRIEYWQVHDLDCATPDEALPLLAQHVENLVNRLAGEAGTDPRNNSLLFPGTSQ
jgi:protein-tyrosine phosphatase